MDIKAGRKNISCLAAILIVVFHLWILVTTSKVESFLKVSSYIGVDMFFFLSAFSLSQRPIENYVKFVKGRFVKVYLKFVVIAIIAFIYKGWRITKLLSIVTMIEFFSRGGGSYLWFVPAIMLFYILFPLFRKVADDKPVAVSIITLVIWAIVAFMMTELNIGKQLLIFINRIPVLVCGYLACKKPIKTNKLFDVVLLVVGTVLLYMFGAQQKLNTPIYNLYYVLAIPFTYALISLLGSTKSNEITGYIGSITLEMYAIQMTFGYDIAEAFYKLTKSPLISNILTILAVIAISGLFNKLYSLVESKLTKK